MLKTLYQAIRGDARPEEIMLNGRPYTTNSVYQVKTPLTTKLEVRSLTAIVDYLATNVDSLEMGNLICHVVSPEKVNLMSAYTEPWLERNYHIQANLDKLDIQFNQFVDAEKFNIMLQACFVDDAETNKSEALAYTGNITQTMETSMEDDGVSQAVEVKSGIANKIIARLPNPITLRPYRTFSEVEQPSSNFVFRVNNKNGFCFSLTDADGGAWKAEAMANIKAFLQEKCPGLNVIA